MNINRNNYFMNFLTSLRTLILALVLSIGVSYAYAAWTAPTQTPPLGNIATPVNIGDNAQIKEGNLMLNNTGAFVNGLIVRYGNVGIGVVNPTEKLDVAGKVKGTELCIGSDCRNVWPAGSGSVDWSSIINKPVGFNDDIDNVGAQKDPTPMYQCPTAQFLCGGGSGAQAYVGTCFGQLSSVITSCRRVFTGSTGCTYEILPCGLAGYLVQ